MKLSNILKVLKRTPGQSRCQHLFKTSALALCLAAVLFGTSFLILEVIRVAMCMAKKENDLKCFNGMFGGALCLFLCNLAIWLIVSRCCFNYCFTGCCYRWRKRVFRKVLQQLELNPHVTELDLNQPNDVVRHLERLVQTTWVYSDHYGNDAHNLDRIEHNGIKIRHIFQIDNKQLIKSYTKNHLKIHKLYRLPEQLVDNPIKTVDVGVLPPTRVVSQLSLSLKDVVEQHERNYDVNTSAGYDATLERRGRSKTSRKLSSESVCEQGGGRERIALKQLRMSFPTFPTNDLVFGTFDESTNVSSSLPAVSLSEHRIVFNLGGSDDDEDEREATLTSDLQHLGVWNLVAPDTTVAHMGLQQPASRQSRQSTDAGTGLSRQPTDAGASVEPSQGKLKRSSSRKSRGKKTGRKTAKKQRSSGSDILQIKSGITDKGEAYLFHGTRLRNVNSIIESGFDLDQCKSGLYGRGIYLAESSQKADQYTDNPLHRRSTFLPMFVVRTSLGKVGVYKNKLKTKPSRGDITNTASTSSNIVGPDTDQSVNAHAPDTNHTIMAGENKRFREFVKREAAQCYPEFLIIYDRETTEDSV